VDQELDKELDKELDQELGKELDQGRDQAFVVVNSDIWTDFPYQRLLDVATGSMAQNRCSAHLVLIENPDHNLTGDFDLGADGLVLPPKQQQKSGAFTFSGISVLKQALFKPFLTPDADHSLALYPVLLQAIKARQVSAEIYGGDCGDIGTPQRLEELDQKIRQIRELNKS
ncbi:MAG: hypothetical protein V3T17_01620, partial [Pseudomonadales bacterium]